MRSHRRTPAPSAAQLPLGEKFTLGGHTVVLTPDPDTRTRVTLMIDGTPHSHIDLNDPTFLAFEYMQYMAAAISQALVPYPRALHLGVGACSMPRWMHAHSPTTHQLGIDLNAELITAVRSWIPLPSSPHLRLRPQDARAYVDSCPPQRWDLIIRDVFASARVPLSTTTAEFHAAVSQSLTPGGLYLANAVTARGISHVYDELATIAAIAPDIERLAIITEPAVLKGRRFGNVVIAWGADVSHWADSSLPRQLRSLPVPATLVTGLELERKISAGKPRTDANVASSDRKWHSV